MSKKNVYFFKIKMIRKEDNSYCTSDEFQSVFQTILNKYSTNMDGNISINLTEYCDNLHTSADYITTKESSVFMRLCKQRKRTGLSKRDYVNNKCDDIIPGTDESQNGVETNTYAYINFRVAIMEIAYAQTAPNERVLQKFFNKYNDKYYVELLAIPNPHSIQSLYDSNSPKIKKLELEIPIPDISYLSEALGWTDKEIEDLVLNGGLKATVCLQPDTDNRGSFICSDESSRKIVDIIKAKGRKKYGKASIVGKENTDNLREYNFFEDNFGFPINVKDSETVNGNIISYNATKLFNSFHKEMTELYYENSNYFGKFYSER